MAATAPQAALALRNILIATDFSSCSERALLHAVAAAHHFNSTLHLVHVVDPAMFSLLPPEAYPGTCAAETRTVELARADASKLAANVLRHAGCQDLKYRTWVSLGKVSETLCSVIRREHIDVAVVGTHGRTGLRKVFMGSVAESVFRHATCPVLTVGPHSWRSDPQALHLKHILFPTDLSSDSANALPFVIAIASEFGSALTLLNIVEPREVEATHDQARLVSAIEQHMREMAAAAGPSPAALNLQVCFGNVAENVIEAAAGLNADLVAFGLKVADTCAGRMRWRHAYKIACEVDCPVLSMRGMPHRG